MFVTKTTDCSVVDLTTDVDLSTEGSNRPSSFEYLKIRSDEVITQMKEVEANRNAGLLRVKELKEKRIKLVQIMEKTDDAVKLGKLRMAYDRITSLIEELEEEHITKFREFILQLSRNCEPYWKKWDSEE